MPVGVGASLALVIASTTLGLEAAARTSFSRGLVAETA
jgi:hypothetical protein